MYKLSSNREIESRPVKREEENLRSFEKGDWLGRENT